MFWEINRIELGKEYKLCNGFILLCIKKNMLLYVLFLMNYFYMINNCLFLKKNLILGLCIGFVFGCYINLLFLLLILILRKLYFY